ncbi:29 kDa ribonucleoprotein A, chloroplastic-like [Chenopodium quinoa]|nr:29 kDa ribonucleoprotein A, chloroplastic-like [Chenopodium quinoa]
MASTSFLASLAPKTLVLSKSTTPSLPFFSLLSSSPSKTLPNSLSFPSLKRYQSLSSRFVQNVAISSEFEQEEDVMSDDGEQQPNFSPDLKLFVGNLPFNVDSAELAGLFGAAGTVEMVEVIYDKMTGRSRGFGFVTMSSVEEVEAAAKQFNGYELDGRPLRVNAGPPPPKRDDFSPRGARGGGPSFGSSNRVHVGNLSWKVDDAALKSLFSEQGEVVEAKVIYDRDSGRSRGFGFVTYNSADEVNSAIESLDGVDLNGREIRVSAAEARQRRSF